MLRASGNNLWIWDNLLLWFLPLVLHQHPSAIKKHDATLIDENLCLTLIEGSLEVKLPTTRRHEMQKWEESETRRKEEKRSKKSKSEERRSRCAKRWESRETLGFSSDLWFRRVENFARWSDGCGASWPDERWKSARPCSAKHISKSKCAKHTESRAIFGSWNVEKVLAVLARRAFWTENIQSTPMPDHFWRLRFPKSARRCGGKHVSKSKCAKHTRFGPLLEVAMSKKCKPLWRAAHVEVKSAKAWPAQPTIGGSDVLFAWQAHGVMHLVK